jgi:hypothetical protein
MMSQHDANVAPARVNFSETLVEDLAVWIQPPHVHDPAKAMATVQAIATLLPDPESAARWLLRLAKQLRHVFDADRALNNWERFCRACPNLPATWARLETSSSLSSALFTLFSGSQYLTDMVLQDPGLVDWLDSEERLSTSRSKEVMITSPMSACKGPMTRLSRNSRIASADRWASLTQSRQYPVNLPFWALANSGDKSSTSAPIST